MATIVVEDGTIVSGANSYVSASELTTFLSDRAYTLSGTYTEAELLILAMDYIESLGFKGFKKTEAQPLQWPRTDVIIDGYWNSVDNIPTLLKNGLMQTALAIDAGTNPDQNTPRKTKREKVGDLEIEYSDGSSSFVSDKKIMNFLYKLLGNGNAGNSIKVSRG